MQIETAVPNKPDVIITLSAAEASLLRTIVGKISGYSIARNLIDELFAKLDNIGVTPNNSVRFTGRFD